MANLVTSEELNMILAKTNYLTVDDLFNRWSGKIKKSTLNQWRYLRKGPKFIKVGGKVLYKEDDVRIFEATHLLDIAENNIQIEVT